MEKRRTRLPLLAVLAVALAAVIGFAPKTAWAVEVNDAESLKTALAAADGDEAVTLTENVELTESLSVAGAKTLDLNGKSITGNCDVLINVPAESVLTIRDSRDGTGSISGGAGQSGAALKVEGTLNLESGSIKSTNAASVVAITGESAVLKMTGGAIINNSTWSQSELPVLQGVSARNGAEVNISGGTVDAPNREGCGVRAYGSDVALSGSGVIKGYYGLFLFNDNNDNTSESKPSSFNMTGGTIDCTVYAIGGNNTSSARCAATISDGVIKSSDAEVCVYWPMEGKLTISGGTFTGGTALEIKMGELNISGGTFEGRDVYMSVFNGGSAYEDGSALKIVGQQYGASEGQYIGSPSLKVAITGGEFSSAQGNAISVYSLSQTVDSSGNTLTTDVTIGDNAVLSSADGRDAVRVLSKNDFTPESGGVKTSNTTIKYAPLADAAAVADGTTNNSAGGGIKVEKIKTLFTSLANATASSDDAQEPISKITLLRDVDEDVTIPEGANVTINFGEHDLVGTVTNNGTLKLDGTGNLLGQVVGKAPESDSTVKPAVAQIGTEEYETLEAAINAAGPDDTIKLLGDATLSQQVAIDKDVTIDGQGHTIYGSPTDKTVNFTVSSGTFTIQNATLTSFGNEAVTESGVAVIKVPSGAAANTKVMANGVTINNFCRAAFDIRSGSFDINGCNIDCTPTIEDNNLTKGIVAGLGATPVTGTVTNTTISFAESTYADWATAGVEIYNNADVTVKGGSITGSKIGVSVDNYWSAGTNAEPAKVIIDGTAVDATEDAVRVMGPADNGNKDVAGAEVSILSGNFTGNIRITESTADSGEIIAISGGTFDHMPDAQYLAEGFAPNENTDGTWGVHQHNLVEHPAKAPTCTEAGNIRYWQCSVSGCDAQFTDAQGTTPVTGSVELEATGHELRHVPAREATADAMGNVEFWYCTNSCHGIFLDGAATKPATLDDVLVPATGEQPVVKHTVTLVYGTGKTETVEVANGALLAMPETPTYDGYTFLAWYTDEALTQEYDFSTPVTGDLTLYAGWRENKADSGKTTTPEQQKPATDAEKTEVLAQTSDPTTFVPVAVAGAAGVSALAGALISRRRQR